MNTPFCNLNCICVNCDCSFNHFPNFKDRKIIKNLFDNLHNPSKFEPYPHIRKANCRFGQLCFNKDCGFRHRLSFNDRNALIKAFNDFKLNNIKIDKSSKIIIHNPPNFSDKNSFDSLSIDDNTIHSFQPIHTSWADLFNDDDDFYMNF